MGKKRKKKTKRSLILLSALSIIGCSMFVYINDRIKTEVVQIIDYKDIVTSRGFILRDEEVISQPESFNKNNVMFTCLNGEKVSKNSIIAKIYSSPEEVLLGYKLDNISRKIEFLEKSLSNTILTSDEGVKELNKKVNENIIKLISSNSNLNTSLSEYIRQNLWYWLNRKQVILKKTDYTNSKLNLLKSEKDSLNLTGSNVISRIIAPHSGKFLRFTDGYETKLNYNNLLSGDIKNLDFNNIFPALSESDKAIGKIVKSDTWYSIFYLPVEEGERLKDIYDAKLNVINTDGSNEYLPSKIELVTPCEENKMIVVISCDYMNSNLAIIRKEEIELNLGDYSGIKINKSSLHKKNNSEFGVFVKRGNYLKFKRVKIIFSKDDFVICSQDPRYIKDEDYLQAGDSVVVSGKNLYDGKKV